ncbi:MAG: hypothetical protein OEN56_07420 [Gemmatimonadota bacterium]|nr:hypothetical protein [Gemmatimonadota bacterium]
MAAHPARIHDRQDRHDRARIGTHRVGLSEECNVLAQTHHVDHRRARSGVIV